MYIFTYNSDQIIYMTKSKQEERKNGKDEVHGIQRLFGSGKTTSMLALAHSLNAHGYKAAILANDLGAGNIVDADFTATSDVLTTSIAGNCICYQHENLVDKLHQLVSAGRTSSSRTSPAAA